MFWKAPEPIVSTLSRRKSVSLVPVKAPEPIVLRCDRSIVLRLLQPLKALSLIVSTLEGSWTSTRLLQPLKAFFSISDKLDGRTTLVRLVHPLNALALTVSMPSLSTPSASVQSFSLITKLWTLSLLSKDEGAIVFT